MCTNTYTVRLSLEMTRLRTLWDFFFFGTQDLSSPTGDQTCSCRGSGSLNHLKSWGCFVFKAVSACVGRGRAGSSMCPYTLRGHAGIVGIAAKARHSGGALSA